MAFIAYVPEEAMAEGERVADRDNIIQIHSVHPAVMRRGGPLRRVQREMMAVVVSALNQCHY